MSTLDWSPLSIVHAFDEVRVLTKSSGVCQNLISKLKSSTKYSFKCSKYRKYPLCNYEIRATVPDDDPTSITMMLRNTHKHKFRNRKSHVPSPTRHSVSKCVHIGLSKSQIRSTLLLDHPILAVPSRKFTSLLQVERQKNCPKTCSTFDFRGRCREHQDGATLHSIFVPFYCINDANGVFVLFTTRELITQI